MKITTINLMNSSEEDEKIEYVGYTSYEIHDFPAALEKWKEFFLKKNKLRLPS